MVVLCLRATPKPEQARLSCRPLLICTVPTGCRTLFFTGSKGGNKFDLTKYNDAYFERLQSYVSTASDHGIVVQIGLFCGYARVVFAVARPCRARRARFLEMCVCKLRSLLDVRCTPHKKPAVSRSTPCMVQCRTCTCVCVRACVRVCVCCAVRVSMQVCVCTNACASACACACVCTGASPCL